jgi:hypothetical protein
MRTKGNIALSPQGIRTNADGFFKFDVCLMISVDVKSAGAF